MVTGAQTNDFDLSAVENPEAVPGLGMNWITTKMPDSHWLTEARLSGTKVVIIITVSTAPPPAQGDEVIIIRLAPTPASPCRLAAGDPIGKLHDHDRVTKNTDLPFLILHGHAPALQTRGGGCRRAAGLQQARAG